MIIVKMNFSRNFSGAVEGSVGSVQFQIVPAYTSTQGLYVPSNVVGTIYKGLIYCTCHFQSSSLCLFWLPLFASLFSV